ncbi:MAG: S8 family serine peptidase [Kiloniellales bacterium]|nr:S8 family serine peptidase [Kiloniellales bacterium]
MVWKGASGLCLSASLAVGLAIASSAAADRTGGTEASARALLRLAPGTLCPEGILEPDRLPERFEGAFSGFTLVDVTDRGPPDTWLRREIRLENAGSDQALLVSATRSSAGLRRVSFEMHKLSAERPIMILLAGGDCQPLHARAIRYDESGGASELVHLGADLTTVETVEPLNPPVPPGTDPGGVTVAHIDSGVNYLLPEIASRLARDGDGRPLGLDLWEDDGRPFDRDQRRSPFFPIRHGTPVASLLIEEAPAVRLLPIRFPRHEMARMSEAVRAAAAADARIAALPMGSRLRADWTGFASAAAVHSEVLFIVSAGNDGRDIDLKPLYPASLRLDNLVVVTSSDAFGRLAPGSNWGAASVDLMVPAEGLAVTDYRGARGTASGSSYAVPRVAALAVRLLEKNPDWTAAELKRALFARAVPPLERGPPRVAVGWIPNPADNGP